MHDSLEKFRKEYPFTYIDVGARWGAKSRLLKLFPNSKWIGFEPDPDEFAAIKSKKQVGQECLPHALSNRSGVQNLYITKSPDWSSLYEPDPEVFSQFNGLENFYHVTHCYEVPVRSLDELVASNGDLLANADYLKIDVQGAEADVLRGAQTLLATSLIVVEVEVEFLQLYKGQPLFDQVHKLMIDNGFFLFDMSRNRCIRSCFTNDIETRGQLIWSDALYFKDFRALLAENRGDKALVLLLIAMELGFPDHSLSILRSMITQGIAQHGIRREVDQALAAFRAEQHRKTRVVDAVARLPYGRRLLRYLKALVDDNYDRAVTLAYPEYYFRRD